MTIILVWQRLLLSVGNCQHYFGLCLYLSIWVGMAGAAIATVMSPLTSLILITLHKWSPQRVLRFEKFKVKFQDVREIMSIGFSSFLNEFSSAFVMFLFNIVLLNLVGHVAISAYAIVANLNIIVIAILQGLGKGATITQPILWFRGNEGVA